MLIRQVSSYGRKRNCGHRERFHSELGPAAVSPDPRGALKPKWPFIPRVGVPRFNDSHTGVFTTRVYYRD